MTKRIVGILLAGGSARRFGSNKLLAILPNGEVVGARAAAAMSRVFNELLVVVPAASGETYELFRQCFEVSVCPMAYAGIGHSIAHGVAQRRDADAWVIGLADMPFIKSETIREVSGAISGPSVIARPRYRETAGHPVGFGASYVMELTRLAGDIGAQRVINAHAESLVFVDTHDIGVVTDIDRPDDIQSYSHLCA